MQKFPAGGCRGQGDVEENRVGESRVIESRAGEKNWAGNEKTTSSNPCVLIFDQIQP